MTIITRLKNKMSILMVCILIPFFAKAEAGKGIDSYDLLFALLILLLIIVNQVYLTILSIKKISNPNFRLSILYYLAFVVSIVVFISSYIKSIDLVSFGLILTLPCLLGVMSLFIEIIRLMRKK